MTWPMQLHEFMSERRDEILATCHLELNEAGLTEPLTRFLEDFFDELTRAIRRDSGLRDSRSPLPDNSEAAVSFGADRKRAGVPVTEVPLFYRAISQAIAETGELYELRISAEEYKMLNRCLDAGLAKSIENYWHSDRVGENQLITERFGFMAHELRNALGNTTLAFKLLRAGGLDVQGRTADVVERNLTRMEALVSQCLGSVQLEVGVAPELVPVHVGSLLRGLEASALPDRQISIQLELDEQLFILGDEMLLTSAMSNLLHNAVKFSPPGSTIRLGVLAADGMALLQVEDQCGGLGHDDPAQLFEPYVKKRASNRPGTGLGLAIVKRAVEAMKGELSVADLPGYGCVFSARFPLLMR